MSDPEDFVRTTDGIVGAALRARRTDLRLSQTELAAALGVTHQQVAKYEAGRDRIGVGQLAAAARFLGRDVAWFFDPENTAAQLRQHCALLPLDALLPAFAGDDITARVMFTRDAAAPWPGLSVDVVTLVEPGRAPKPLPRQLYPAMLRHGEGALLALAAAEGDAAPSAGDAPRAGAALN